MGGGETVVSAPPIIDDDGGGDRDRRRARTCGDGPRGRVETVLADRATSGSRSPRPPAPVLFGIILAVALGAAAASTITRQVAEGGSRREPLSRRSRAGADVVRCRGCAAARRRRGRSGDRHRHGGPARRAAEHPQPVVIASPVGLAKQRARPRTLYKQGVQLFVQGRREGRARGAAEVEGGRTPATHRRGACSVRSIASSATRAPRRMHSCGT